MHISFSSIMSGAAIFAGVRGLKIDCVRIIFLS